MLEACQRFDSPGRLSFFQKIFVENPESAHPLFT